MRLREKSLQKNLVHVKKKEEEVKKKEEKLKLKEEELKVREDRLLEKEREIEELERQLQEMQRLKQNSGSSTTAGYSDGGVNDSLAKNSSADHNLFTSPMNNMNELMDSVGFRPNDTDCN
jgi:DNA repair exonuclease SbcCD ATPase subunit